MLVLAAVGSRALHPHRGGRITPAPRKYRAVQQAISLAGRGHPIHIRQLVLPIGKLLLEAMISCLAFQPIGELTGVREYPVICGGGTMRPEFQKTK